MQQIIAIKEVENCKILASFRKIIKLELKDCKIVEDSIIKIKYLLIKNKIYISRSKNNILYVEAIRFQYKLSNVDYFDRIETFEKIQNYYYWFILYLDIKKYIRSCSINKYIKSYREYKYNLRKLLFILDRYWQNISCNFIISLLFYCYKEKLFQHILIIIDRLFKYKNFIFINFLKVKIIVQIFIDFV